MVYFIHEINSTLSGAETHLATLDISHHAALTTMNESQSSFTVQGQEVCAKEPCIPVHHEIALKDLALNKMANMRFPLVCTVMQEY